MDSGPLVITGGQGLSDNKLEYIISLHPYNKAFARQYVL
jgi:hypothetical protein